tara:strand:+ start:175 stop:660 length:486 start_codon:yes stop_codon:yes gene_type:complete
MTEQKSKIPTRRRIRNTFQSLKKWYTNANKREVGFFNRPKEWIIAGLVTTALIGGCSKLNNVITEDSVYQGQIVSFGREGVIWDTYEGYFAIGGEGRSVTGHFSLDEQARNGENTEELAEQLYKAVEEKSNVSIHGTKSFFCWPWRSSSNYHIDKVELLEE